MSLQVSGGTAGAGARLEELDALAGALVDASADCGALVVAVLAEGAGQSTDAVLDTPLGLPVDPWAAAELAEATATAVGLLCRAGAELATLASAVALTAGTYRARESALDALWLGVPLVVGARVRSGLLALVPFAPMLPAVSAVLTTGTGLLGTGAGLLGTGAGLGSGRAAGGGAPDAPDGGSGGGGLVPTLSRPLVEHPALVDGLVRIVPAVLGAPGVPAAARVVAGLGDVSGLLVETSVAVERYGPAAPPGGPMVPMAGQMAVPMAVPGAPRRSVRPADGVAELLRRNQSVAAWRRPGPGSHDTLPPGQVRPRPGQVRIDRVAGADGTVAWVVHVPGTQQWDGDGTGTPMDMAANVGLVAGSGTAVAAGVAAAMTRAGVRPGQPVAVVGHSQGGMTALDLAADPSIRRAATITHVVTAGSPLAGRTPPAGVQVLALEHPGDLVPRLDGRSHPDRTDRVTVRAPAPGGPWRTDAVPAHSSSAYVVTAARVDSSTHPSLVAYRAGLAPFLDREGAVCTTQQFVLHRADDRDGPA